MIRHGTVSSGGVRLHTAEGGPADGPLAIFLHGFPDHWASWRGALEFGWNRHRRLIAPDGRGVNESEAPDDLGAYAIERLVGDVLAIADHAGARQFDLVGHDWGGVVAWSVAQAAPERMRRLAILNAPHPFLFGEALARSAEQQRRSRYISTLRGPGAEALLSESGFARLRAIYGELAQTPTFDIAASIESWRRPGGLTGALNWYRAATFLDDGGALCRPEKPLALPVLLMWGERDEAFSPSLADAHHRIAARLTIERGPWGHWPHLQAPDAVLQRLSQWLDATDD
jgi:pimeloyl-ACP methyl ester carboxylesterase